MYFLIPWCVCYTQICDPNMTQGLNNKKNLPAGGAMLRCLDNIATYMEALPMDLPSNLWTTICNHFQAFLAKLPCILPLKVGNKFQIFCQLGENIKVIFFLNYKSNFKFCWLLQHIKSLNRAMWALSCCRSETFAHFKCIVNFLECCKSIQCMIPIKQGAPCSSAPV